MNKSDIKKLAQYLKNMNLRNPVSIMEVCGTHTTEFFKTGLRDLFPEGLRLVDGPGCPVCVTPNEYIDTAIEIGKKYNAIITTFGDMVKVPSSHSSLGKERAEGMSVEIVYSPLEAIAIAEKNPNREVVFLSVGFETTAPSEAVVVLEAREKNLKNFSILPGNKLTVPAVRALLDSREVIIDGFILPGHVSAIIGERAWGFIADEYNKPCVIAGFEDYDLLISTLSLLRSINSGESGLINEYKRIVKPNGNETSREIMYKVFEDGDSHWRGIGIIPGSGLYLRNEYSEFDASKKFSVTLSFQKEATECRCGELLRGLIIPTDCSLFGAGCQPEHPVGPCMVSSEGPCSAYYKYGRR